MKGEVRQEARQADYSLPLHTESLLAPGETEMKSRKDPQQGVSSHLKQSHWPFGWVWKTFSNLPNVIASCWCRGLCPCKTPFASQQPMMFTGLTGGNWQQMNLSLVFSVLVPDRQTFPLCLLRLPSVSSVIRPPPPAGDLALPSPGRPLMACKPPSFAFIATAYPLFQKLFSPVG